MKEGNLVNIWTDSIIYDVLHIYSIYKPEWYRDASTVRGQWVSLDGDSIEQGQMEDDITVRIRVYSVDGVPVQSYMEYNISKHNGVSHTITMIGEYMWQVAV